MNIGQIEIYIYSSIPNKTEPILFTKDILCSPELKLSNNLDKLPYFLSGQILPMEIITNMDYNERVAFFFDKNKFYQTINEDFMNDDEENEEPNEQPNEQPNTHEIDIKNIKFMFEMLLGNTFPNQTNIIDSNSKYILQDNNNDLSLQTLITNIPTSFNKLFFNDNFACIQLDGTKYTVSRITVLNDIYNNPNYKKLINYHWDFKINLSKMSKNINTIIYENELLDNNEFNEMIEYISNSITKIVENLKKTKGNKYNIFTNKIAKSDIEQDLSYHRNSDNYLIALNNYRTIIKKLVHFLMVKEDYFTTPQDNKQEVINGYYEKFKEKELDDKKIAPTTDEEYEILKKAKENYDDFFENIKNMIDRINPVLQLETRFKNAIDNLFKKIKKKYIYLELRYKYIRLKPTSFNIKKEEEFIKEELKNKYPLFYNYIEEIEKFIEPNITSTNTELQQYIDDYIKKQDISEDKIHFGIIMDEIHNKYNNKKKTNTTTSRKTNTKKRQISRKKTKTPIDISNITNIGIIKINSSKITKPQYKIEIFLDLIEGIIDKQDIQKTKCKYKNLLLGKKINDHILKHASFDVVDNSYFISSADISINNKTQTINKRQTINKKVYSGGMYKTRKVRNKYISSHPYPREKWH